METPRGTHATSVPDAVTRDANNETEANEANAIIARLGMRQHVEGGYYAAVNKFTPEAGTDRAPCSVTYFLLMRDQKSHWHKLDATEVWLWHLGSPLEITISNGGERVDSVNVLGPDLEADQKLQVVVPKDAWQTARPLNGWTLVSCMMVPQFTWSGFTLAPPDWVPCARIQPSEKEPSTDA